MDIIAALIDCDKFTYGSCDATIRCCKEYAQGVVESNMLSCLTFGVMARKYAPGVVESNVLCKRNMLYRPNMTYMVQEIRKGGFEELDILIAPGVGAISIPKTMVFTDSIDEGIAIAAYLRTLLDESSHSKRRAIIRSISSSLTADTRTSLWRNSRTEIPVCWFALKPRVWGSM